MKKHYDTTCENCNGSGKVCAYCSEAIETKSSGTEGLDWCENCGMFEPELMDCPVCNGYGQIEESEAEFNAGLLKGDEIYKSDHEDFERVNYNHK